MEEINNAEKYHDKHMKNEKHISKLQKERFYDLMKNTKVS